ncbi:hypothetical protein FA15DRAFT_671302 [Coprinopsis marcescibilis]|uniref:F-box domain-containing protein n=1 Tax=Coprinopsis marcescibilis TaxID=230819 RepID=A0A5C3KQL6_COPMA|nr:hypothetical protein FA15DRAFT_671302 [Coprinopsis marcescibilis]
MADGDSVCPISRFPKDIFEEIFLAAAEISLVQSIHNQGNPKVIPEVAISHVCSSWRDVSLNLPKLWSSIALYDGYDEMPWLIMKPLGTARVDQFRAYLERSKGCLLDMTLWLEISRATPLQSVEGQEETVGLELIRLWLDHLERWKSVRIKLSYTFTEVIHFLNRQKPTLQGREAPFLEVFEFVTNASTSGNISLTHLNIPVPASLQRSCSKLNRLSLPSSSFALALPLLVTNNLTGLRITRVDGHPILCIPCTTLLSLIQLPNLTALFAEGIMFSGEQVLQRPIATKSLRLLRWHRSDLVGSRLLSNLHATALEVLHLQDMMFEPSFSLKFRFLRLHTLHIKDCLSSRPGGPAIFNCIRVLGQASPNIRSITFMYHTRVYLHAFVQLLQDCLCSRGGAEGPLTKLDRLAIWVERDLLGPGKRLMPVDSEGSDLPWILKLTDLWETAGRSRSGLFLKMYRDICYEEWAEKVEGSLEHKVLYDQIKRSCRFGYHTDGDFSLACEAPNWIVDPVMDYWEGGNAGIS